LTSDIGRETRREQRNNQLYEPPLPHSAPKGKLIGLKQKKCRQRSNTAKQIVELKKTTICKHQKERVHVATDITPPDNKKCKSTLA